MHKTIQVAQLITVCLLANLLVTTSWALEITADFEDLSLASESFNNGDPGGLVDNHDGSFVSQGVTFTNTFTRTVFPPNPNPVAFWNGWSYSNLTDNTTPGFGNQYSAFASALPGAGSGGSQNYGISFGEFDTAVAIPTGYAFQSIDITNSTYTALSMRDGDSFAKKFGGATGDDPDFFKLIITGRSGGASGAAVGSVEFYLADYRFDDDYIIDEWTTVDLTSLATADTLTFSFDSSDVGDFGVNTPTFFAADNLVLTVPEPSALVLVGVALAALLLALARRTNFLVRSRK